MLQQFKQIKCFVFDIDGVLTDGTLLIMGDGQMLRSMNIKDGYALQLAVKKGYHVVIISGADNEAARIRMDMLGVKNVFLKVTDKLQQLNDFLLAHKIAAAQVLYMGDDIPDYDVMKSVGLPCCPADAVPEIKQVARYIAIAKGGTGCAREVIEKVLKLNSHWEIDATVTSK